jgi:glycosyltransferase involved in cell wall biosynthesis
MEGIRDCQIIVVDDGSTDHTATVAAAYEKKYSGLFGYLQQEHRGPAAARNAGLQAAEKDLILFLDDDVMPDRGLIGAHLAFIECGFDLSQGILHWHPEIASGRVLRYMERRGQQFAFNGVIDDSDLSFLYVYTANMAVPKKHILKHGGFDEKLASKGYGFEDTGLAFKLKQANLRLGLNRKAQALHFHPMTEDQLVQRNQKVGYGYGVIEDAYPKIAATMKLKCKMAMPGLQIALLYPLILWSGLKRLIGWELFLRLRCRDAFLRGLIAYRNG